MRSFLACYNLVKNNRIFHHPCTDREITPCLTCHSNFSVISLVRGEMLLLKLGPFLDPGHNMRSFGLFYQNLHNFYSIFKVLKHQQKRKNMMWCIILHVETTETLLGQRRKAILVNNDRSCQSRFLDIILLNYWSPLPPINWRIPD